MDKEFIKKEIEAWKATIEMHYKLIDELGQKIELAEKMLEMNRETTDHVDRPEDFLAPQMQQGIPT